MTRFEKFKSLWKQYGYVFVGYYTVVWAIPFLPLFAMCECNVIDCMAALEWLHVGDVVDLNSMNTRYVNLFVSFELNELIGWVTLPFVVATTPRVSQWWRDLSGGRKQH